MHNNDHHPSPSRLAARPCPVPDPQAKLLPALLVGLLVYHLIHLIADRLVIGKLSGRNAKILSVILVAGLVITLLVF
jgi:hypothetical protein